MKTCLTMLLAMTVGVSGCMSDGSASGKRGMTDMEAGAAIGAAGGAAVGALVTKKHLKGALIGAAGGGLAGGAVGAYMDSQKKDLDKNPNRSAHPVRSKSRSAITMPFTS